ncbi:hypothetical protein GH714_026433 [Hevea brasiliensis]|uniref:Uncharacterized protein n=1 Tax=Hevea brasiliensis TaxID=3981 RepID=A0A6A6MMF9_HEVBR|nr:hypothetical protein GH714_026433 [Hevea brasiliensis]
MDEEEYELVVEAAIVHNEIEVRDLPIGFHSEAVATQLGNFISQFSDYDMRVDMGSCRNFMSIRVSGDVRKPLKRWKKLRSENDGPLVEDNEDNVLDVDEGKKRQRLSTSALQKSSSLAHNKIVSSTQGFIPNFSLAAGPMN